MSIKKLFHWGPLLAFFMIKFISLTSMISMGIWLPSNKSTLGFINFLVYCSQLGIVVYNFFCAILQGPGYVPLNWKPEKQKIQKLRIQTNLNEEDTLNFYLQYCSICEGFKAPRSHHCRKCNRCILKMDHHCPWINNCCGHNNQVFFLLFLMFAVTGSLHSLIILSITVYRGYNASWYYFNSDKSAVVLLTFKYFVCLVLSIGFCIGIILGVGYLLYTQLKILFKNMTSIEEWIMTKANARTNGNFIYPYDLGVIQNFLQVFWENTDGINYKIKNSCHEFSLTAEQVQQKTLKKEKTKLFFSVEDYNGKWFPLFSKGFMTCVNFPFSDEPRINFKKSEYLKVTRYKKYWFYGEKEIKKNSSSNVEIEKGWFPSRCVVEVINSKIQTNEKKTN